MVQLSLLKQRFENKLDFDGNSGECTKHFFHYYYVHSQQDILTDDPRRET